MNSTFKLSSTILVLVIVLSVTNAENEEQSASQTTSSIPPNIVIIMADDMGFDDVSFRGSREFITPNIDALAYHGKILDRLYAPAMCTPSRGALLTGRYPIHTGTQHYVISNEEPWSLPTNVSTLAQIFQNAGYSTNLVGKWHLGYAKQEFTPTYRGFDYHYGYWGAYIDYYKRTAQMPTNNFSIGYDFRRNLELECEKPDVYVTDLLTAEAERIIATNGNEKPILLIVNHLAVHTANEHEPLQAPQAEINKFNYIKDPKRRIYAAMVSKLDQSVGRIINALAKANSLENSIVLFYSDNGGPTVGHFSNTGLNWPLKGQKNSPWEGGVRVAGAIWSAAMHERSTVFRQPIYVGDMLPTLAHAADIDLSDVQGIDGIDLWPQLQAANPATATEHISREILHQLDDVWHVISFMQDNWKYVNGSTLNGRYDSLVGYREEYDFDPRDQRYVVEVRNSLASKALSKYDERRLTRHRIETLRADAAVQCGTQQRGCNALLEECLYDLKNDPCENNNLAALKQYSDVLNRMRVRVQELRESAWPIGNKPPIWQSDPSWHQCTWCNFLEQPTARIPLDCDDGDLACSA